MERFYSEEDLMKIVPRLPVTKFLTGKVETQEANLREKMAKAKKEHPGIRFQFKLFVWDEADGYPEHVWGYTQCSVRPYFQGMGCDGTTDGNILLIAREYCERIRIDFVQAYNRAYAERDGFSERSEFDYLEDYRSETCIPDEIDEALVLDDLNDINFRSMVSELEEEFERIGRLTCTHLKSRKI